jgi:hypothetical protein
MISRKNFPSKRCGQERTMGKKANKESNGNRTANYRVLVKQALSLDVSGWGVGDLTIQGAKCWIAIKPAHSELAKQREIGGSSLAIEFETEEGADLTGSASGRMSTALAAMSDTFIAAREMESPAAGVDHGLISIWFVWSVFGHPNSARTETWKTVKKGRENPEYAPVFEWMAFRLRGFGRNLGTRRPSGKSIVYLFARAATNDMNARTLSN